MKKKSFIHFRIFKRQNTSKIHLEINMELTDTKLYIYIYIYVCVCVCVCVCARAIGQQSFI